MRDLDALVAYIEGRAALPFAWGSDWSSGGNDCVSYAAGAVHAQTGRDVLAELGVAWATERRAVSLLKRFGGVEGAAGRALRPIPVAMAHRGDVGLVKLGDRASLVIFEGATVVGPGEVAEVRLPRQAATAAWSIEEASS